MAGNRHGGNHSVDHVEPLQFGEVSESNLRSQGERRFGTRAD